MTSHMPKNSYTKKTNKLVIFSILRHNLSKFVTQTGLYCSKQLETTFNQVVKKSSHIIINTQTNSDLSSHRETSFLVQHLPDDASIARAQLTDLLKVLRVQFTDRLLLRQKLLEANALFRVKIELIQLPR